LPGRSSGVAYNRWLADYCKPYADRLFGVAMLPMQSVDLAIDEMRHAREVLGMRDGLLRPNPYHGNKMISDPIYEPFWTMAEALDFSIGFHEGSTTAMPTVGVDRFEKDRAARHMISHMMEMMLAAMAVVWGGVVDRHPRLRIAFLESGGGWIAPWLDRMVTSFELKVHPAETVLAGLVLHPASVGKEALQFWREFGPTAPKSSQTALSCSMRRSICRCLTRCAANPSSGSASIRVCSTRRNRHSCRMRSAYRPATYARLSALKKKYAWIAYSPRKCQWFLEPSACVEKLWKQNLLKIFFRVLVCRRSVDPISAQ
jgi:Amidohydrolase